VFSGNRGDPERRLPVEIRRIEGTGEAPAMTLAPTLTPQERTEQQQLIRAVKAVNEAQLFGQESELTFAFDRQTRRTVVKIVNKETQEVIRQIPSEYLLRLAEEARR
jgi:flagellar protein FlaG